MFGGERFFHIRKKHTSGFSVKEESRKITNSLEDFGTATEDFRAMIKAQVSEEWILDFFKKTVAYKEVSEALKKEKFKEMKNAVDRDAELEKLTVNFSSSASRSTASFISLNFSFFKASDTSL